MESATSDSNEPIMEESLKLLRKSRFGKFDKRLISSFIIGCVLVGVLWFPIHFLNLWMELAFVAPQFVAAAIAVNGVFLGFLPTLSIFIARTLNGLFETGQKILSDIEESSEQRQARKHNILAMGHAAKQFDALAQTLLELDKSQISQNLLRSKEWQDLRQFRYGLTRQTEKQLQELEVMEKELIERQKLFKGIMDQAEGFCTRVTLRYRVGFWLIAIIVIIQSICLLFCYGQFLYPSVAVVLIGLIIGVTIITTLFEPVLFLRTT